MKITKEELKNLIREEILKEIRITLKKERQIIGQLKYYFKPVFMSEDTIPSLKNYLTKVKRLYKEDVARELVGKALKDIEFEVKNKLLDFEELARKHFDQD